MELYHPFTGQPVGYISNLFYFHNHRYYLIQLMNPLSIPQIVANQQGFPIGLVIHFGTLVVCLSCRDLLDSNKDYSQLIPTDETTRKWLQRTVYVESQGFYGTGVRVSSRVVATAKHIIPEAARRVDGRVKIGVYPYNRVLEGRVGKVDAVRDYLEIELLGELEQLGKELEKDHEY